MRNQQPNDPVQLTRGRLAALSGVNLETIRYYEKQGLMPAPPRTPSGHRIYDLAQLKRLLFIRRSRDLGFSQEQVRGLLRFVDGGDYTCADVKTLTVEHLDAVRRKLADLRKIERVLKEMSDRCDGGEVPDCPVVDALIEQSGWPEKGRAV